MKIPDFEDFLASVNFEEAEEIAEAICYGSPEVLSFDATDISSFGPALQSGVENTLVRANANTIALLKLYHLWLQNHLET